MNIKIIIQARFSSARLPGKILRDIQGKKILEHALDALEGSDNTPEVILATSDEQSDDVVEEFCHERGTTCYRGSLKNVASRFNNIINEHKLDAFVRICGDSPLILPEVIETAIKYYTELHPDVATNTFKRTYPRGQSVEVVNAEVFCQNFPDFSEERDFEHVTQYFYRNSDKFNIHNFNLDQDLSHLNFCVDTQEDFDKISHIFASLSRAHPEYSLKELCRIYQEQTGQ